MRVTVAIVLLLVFFVCFSQADEHTLFLSKLKKAVSKAKSAITKTSSKVVRTVNKAKNVVGKVKSVVSKAKDLAGKAKKAVAGLKDKLMSFAKYGNHCGKGHGKAGVPVKDAVDLSCYHHDRCYEAFGFGNCGCDRDAIVEIKKALKTNVSWKAKAAARVGLIWLSKHGCDYVSKTADGTCTKGKNKNLKGSDTKLWYSCSAKTFTAPTAPNAAAVIAKFYGKKAAPVTASGKIDREVKRDDKKIKKLESLLGDKKKRSGKKSAGKKTAGKKSTGKKAATRKGGKKSAGKKTSSKRASGKKGSKKAATRKGGKSGKKASRKGGKKSVKSLESLVNKQLKKVNKVSSGKKAGRKSRKARKAGKRRGCGAGLSVSFSGKTTVSIGNVKI